MNKGKFYVASTGNGYEPLAMLEISSISTIEEPEERADDYIYIPKLAYFDSIEISAKLLEEAPNKLFGICSLVYNCCPNKKIVHLAKHARKRKTRKKNFNRSIRILEKEVKKRSDDIL
jgi:hypothetical protein|nr:MAG TPA: hypothetical protein [Caudoviricetes sp.]